MTRCKVAPEFELWNPSLEDKFQAVLAVVGEGDLVGRSDDGEPPRSGGGGGLGGGGVDQGPDGGDGIGAGQRGRDQGDGDGAARRVQWCRTGRWARQGGDVGGRSVERVVRAAWAVAGRTGRSRAGSWEVFGWRCATLSFGRERGSGNIGRDGSV